jgi:hypothetical protein
MTHKQIKRFQINGQISDDAFLRMKETYINQMFSNMRSKGYVPILDLDSAFSTEWNGSTFDFVLTVHGVYYGQTEARKIYGLADNKEILLTEK